MNRIPFRAGPQVMQELIAGRVHFYVSPTLAVMPQYQSKLLKILAVSSPERLKGGGSEIPTLNEKGIEFRALRLARDLRRRRHAAADRRSAQPSDRVDRRIRPSTATLIEKGGSLPVSSTPERLADKSSRRRSTTSPPPSANSGCSRSNEQRMANSE